QASPDVLASAALGFHLIAALGRDTTVKGDTLVVPTYGCKSTPWELAPGGQLAERHAHVRLGTLRTPFYDSVVVATFEIPHRAGAARRDAWTGRLASRRDSSQCGGDRRPRRPARVHR